MPTSSPTDFPQPSEPTGPVPGTTPTVESAPTVAITKVPGGAQPPVPPQPTAPVWTPRPHEQLSPEDKDLTDLTDDELEALTADSVSTGVLGGAAAIVSGVLGLASITGTWLGSQVNDREKLIGSINSGGKSPAVQLSEGYTKPWHMMAAFNGMFALVAIVVGVAVLFAGRFLATRPLPNWVRAVAWAGLALGLLGVLVSCGVYFGWFTSTITLPAASTASTGQ
ncbi:hypothetical protein [Streptacidiphilus sp. EB129]|uniref:hypothetical protein n=1 Tax=Streptacidiphilus sp. EB129 TaxID=3156262 RepID=UPI003512FF29